MLTIVALTVLLVILICLGILFGFFIYKDLKRTEHTIELDQELAEHNLLEVDLESELEQETIK
ncbi:hypothetical protein [Spiroplasma eriocheiris]|uniref:Uncharacterized protein n=1 Tax=Spiroplasma eriocheiris TaxID=315358 RepID=A0A0H3XKC5_9MOLU|nr:hypothetical protein [Spiroplasma eriocheiris]AHF57908.1 hypothetical protein SPE_0786 [Spiroplasma eriocheiris CCTCC M 207170]AKM54351.1 hypothetical protein SERIO_v1c07890 [Spiroplasma eriocheiris]